MQGRQVQWIDLADKILDRWNNLDKTAGRIEAVRVRNDQRDSVKFSS